MSNDIGRDASYIYFAKALGRCLMILVGMQVIYILGYWIDPKG
jgi:hypothetical protein